MSRQIGSLHRSNSHPANLQTQILIIPLFAFPPPDSPIINLPSSMNSDTNSDISVFHSNSQFNNSDVETPDEFADSEPSPSTHTQTNSSVFSKPLFRNIQSSYQLPSLSTASYASQVTLPRNSQKIYINHPEHTNTKKNFLKLPYPHFHNIPYIPLPLLTKHKILLMSTF